MVQDAGKNPSDTSLLSIINRKLQERTGAAFRRFFLFSKTSELSSAAAYQRFGAKHADSESSFPHLDDCSQGTFLDFPRHPKTQPTPPPSPVQEKQPKKQTDAFTQRQATIRKQNTQRFQSSLVDWQLFFASATWEFGKCYM
jgi:hypothetical protein